MLTGEVSGTAGFYEIYYAGTATPFSYSNGKLKAIQVLRDGNAPDSMGIPYILTSLNTLAQGIAEAFNNVHSAGYTRPYGSQVSQTGINFFDASAGGYGDITAGTLALSAQYLPTSTTSQLQVCLLTLARPIHMKEIMKMRLR